MGKKILFILLACVVLVIVVLWSNNLLRAKMIIGLRRFSFVYKGWMAAEATSPEAAYAGFRQALAAASPEVNRYLSPSAEEEYRFILSNPEKRQMILAWPEKLTKIFQVPCDEFEGCEEQAVYSLDYYQEETKVEFRGKETVIKAGNYKREVVFMKRRGGGWWIKKL